MVESPSRTQGLSPTFQASSVNTRANPVPTANYGNEFESYLVSALNDSLIRKSKLPKKCFQGLPILVIALLLVKLLCSSQNQTVSTIWEQSFFSDIHLLGACQLTNLSFSLAEQIKSSASSSLPGGPKTAKRIRLRWCSAWTASHMRSSSRTPSTTSRSSTVQTSATHSSSPAGTCTSAPPLTSSARRPSSSRPTSKHQNGTNSTPPS